MSTREISELKREIDRLKSQLTRMSKPHVVQGKRFAVAKKDPANVKAGDLDDDTIQIYRNEDDGTIGLIFRDGGEIRKLEGTAL